MDGNRKKVAQAMLLLPVTTPCVRLGFFNAGLLTFALASGTLTKVMAATLFAQAKTEYRHTHHFSVLNVSCLCFLVIYICTI